MHSRVREQSGITFAGGEYEASFVLADVRMEWPLSREEVTLFYSPRGFVVVAPLPNNRFRIVATTEVAPEVPSLEFMQAVLDARGPTTNPGRIHDVSSKKRGPCSRRAENVENEPYQRNHMIVAAAIRHLFNGA
jgi:2-polyprenyl-6-methoxyphenol hydroxylase-like FAD-dependent oxidoreductase